MKNLFLILFLSLQTFALGNAEGNTIQETEVPRSVSTSEQAYDAAGEKVWECALDIYGKAMTVEGEASFVPFRFQGQYEDCETGLCYNRFRYYSADSGTYISQDPIGLAGGMPNMYSYVPDSNFQLDVFGLHLNTNGATGNFGVYEIKINGDLHKIGKADLNRITKKTNLPTRLHQQLRKLRKIHGKGNVTGEVVEKGFKTTADAKTVETARLQKHFDETGEILDGNKKSFKPSYY